MKIYLVKQIVADVSRSISAQVGLNHFWMTAHL